MLAAYIDIYLFHLLKGLARVKYFWPGNIFSTLLPFFADTFSVLFLLCTFNKIELHLFGPLSLSRFLFRALVADRDTPFLYISVFWLQKKFGLKADEELNL